MALSTDLIKEFVKETNDVTKVKTETTCYGTAFFNGDEGFVKIDGSDILTPASFATSAHTNDRVLILLKGHQAIVIANITTPSLTLGILKATVGVIVEGYLTTNEDRITYDDTRNPGLTFSNGGIGGYGGVGDYWVMANAG